MMTRSMRADLGVMISALHNSFSDNGIKLFDPDGFKLSDEAEQRIEELMQARAEELLASPDKIGRAKRIESAQERYIEFAKRTLPRSMATPRPRRAWPNHLPGSARLSRPTLADHSRSIISAGSANPATNV